ncbi:hypothetical protein T484DRAFT_1910147 [Baffinella frigidus]|nr:hypothetical protein T484DRAFT_1910147 [Cryptophyta sp. CCMP2293]
MGTGELLKQRKLAMARAPGRLLERLKDPAKRKEHEEMLPWSSGLLDVTLDSELLAMANGGVCGACCFFFLPAKTMVDVENGAETMVDVENGAEVWHMKHAIAGGEEPHVKGALVWHMKHAIAGNEEPQVWHMKHAIAGDEEPQVKGAFGVKFSSPGQAMVFNAAVLTACPPVRVLWRYILRQKYLVQGKIWGDVFAVTACYLCSALQEQREVRIAEDPLFAATRGGAANEHHRRLRPTPRCHAVRPRRDSGASPHALTRKISARETGVDLVGELGGKSGLVTGGGRVK